MRTMTAMIWTFVMIGPAVVGQTTGVGDNRLTAAEQAAGFELLFDGETLEGYIGHDPHMIYWELRDGMIVGHHDGTLERNNFLFSEETYGDFVLRASCCLKGGNSGIQYRSEIGEDGHAIGYQADMAEEASGQATLWGSLYDEGTGRGMLADGWAGLAETVVEPRQWNEYEIICQGNRIIQRVNGLTCVDLEDDRAAEGVIAFQVHTGGPMEVCFKNVRLKALAPDEPIPDATPGVPAGWTGLFAGEDLDAFDVVGNPQGFIIEQGGILRSPGASGGEWLRSKKQYSDFVLHVEYMISPGGNSGVFVRSAAEGAPWVTGHECQISNEQPPRDELHCTGTLYGTVAANPRPDESPEVWHTYEIHCVGSLITVIVDQQRTVNVDATEVEAIGDKALSGYVGVQDSHTGPEGWVQFRNIWIKELAPGE